MSGARVLSVISACRQRRLVAAPYAGNLIMAAVTALALTLLPGLAWSAAKPAAATDPSRPHVYLMRGLLNIFSLGMDQLAVQIARHGIDASVYNHTLSDAVVADIVAKYKSGDHGPYILVGHSLGADAVMEMAQQLNARGVPVALVVPFDGTNSYAAAPNVGCVLNITQRLYAYMTPGAGFRGKLSNVNVSSDSSIDHFTIDKSPRLQAMALTSVLQAAHGETCRPGANGPMVASPKPAPSVRIGPPRIAAPMETVPGETPAGALPALRTGVAG
jgi:pimeloyl-ACP methyl ester carboxylesterase